MYNRELHIPSNLTTIAFYIYAYSWTLFIYIVYIHFTFHFSMLTEKPKVPKIDSCIVYNWSRMVCKWSPSLEEQKNHTGLEVRQYLVWILRYAIYDCYI